MKIVMAMTLHYVCDIKDDADAGDEGDVPDFLLVCR